MRAEIYSVRSNRDEISFVSTNIKEISKALDCGASIRVLYKTEIDSNPRKIKKDLVSGLNSDNPPEFYVYLNALDTQDSSSFRRLFTPTVETFEQILAKNSILKSDTQAGRELHLVVSPVFVEGESYPGYCFIFQNKKFLALPREKFINSNYTEYLVAAVNRSKEIFLEQTEKNSQGYVISGLASTVALNKSETAAISNLNNTVAPKISFDDEIFSPESEVESTTPLTPIDEKAEDTPNQELTDKENTSPSKEAFSPSDVEDKLKKKKSVKKFFLSFIPHKGDSKKNVILKIVILLAFIAFIVGGVLLLNFFVICPAINDANMKEIQNIFYSGSSEPVTIVDDEGNAIEITDQKNWNDIKKINKEIVGWIKIGFTLIDYPVLEHIGDNEKSQFYLYRNFKKEPSDFGSIFMDYRCPESVNSTNVILHGHNMGNDKSMFNVLTKYPGNIKFYKSAPIIHFDTPEQEGDYIIFSVMKVNVSNKNEAIFNYLMGEFEGSAQYMNFVYNLKERSYINVDIPINENDHLLTLSTCSYETENMRTVVVGRKIREGEDVNKYIKSAKKQTPNQSVYTLFSSEYKDGSIKWYDGNGKLEGNEEIPYMEVGDMYVVKYVDSTGKAISTQYVLKGEDAEVPEEKPGKVSEKGYQFFFKGWSSNGKNIQKNTIIEPVYTKKKIPPLGTERTWPTVDEYEEDSNTELPTVTDPNETSNQ